MPGGLLSLQRNFIESIIHIRNLAEQLYHIKKNMMPNFLESRLDLRIVKIPQSI